MSYLNLKIQIRLKNKLQKVSFLGGKGVAGSVSQPVQLLTSSLQYLSPQSSHYYEYTSTQFNIQLFTVQANVFVKQALQPSDKPISSLIQLLIHSFPPTIHLLPQSLYFKSNPYFVSLYMISLSAVLLQ